MDESSKSPQDPVRQRTRALLGIAAFFSAAAGAAGVLPWRIEELFEEQALTRGYQFVEGILEMILGGLCLALFLGALATSSQRLRSRLGSTAAVLSFGIALLPLELYARSTWMGVRSVLVLGAGYVGWALGLYGALLSGFLAAGMGSVAAADLHRPTTVQVRRPRRPRPNQ
jgi:hypothetical protein